MHYVHGMKAKTAWRGTHDYFMDERLLNRGHVGSYRQHGVELITLWMKDC